MAATMALRAAVHRLTATPVEELPPMAAYLASTLGESGAILSAPENQKRGAGASDTALLVTKLKTRITSLLQDKTIEGRWTAVILVKSAVEAGQWEILRGCEPWVRALLTILGKPDPTSSKKLSLITLTRIFQLTHEFPTLIREITTPSLPSFVTACLNLISVKSVSDGSRKLKQNNALAIPVLNAFSELLPSHPTIFRPFSAQIHDLLLHLIGSIGSPGFISEPLVLLAQKLFVCLHHCAPKNTSDGEWDKAYRATILSIHRTGDHLFRGIREQWESADPELRQSSKLRNYSEPVGDDGPDPLGLRGWNGVQEGSGRLVSLLNLLSQFLSMRTHSSVSIPVGSTLDFTARLTSLKIPVGEGEDSNLVAREIGRDERESVFSELPNIYIAALNVICTLVKTIGTGSIPIAQSCLDQALWVFDSGSSNRAVRAATYRCITTLLPVTGYTLTKTGLSLLTPVMRFACTDLLPAPLDQVKGNASTEKRSKTKGGQMAINADAFLGTSALASTVDNGISTLQDIQLAALQLLINVLTCAPTELLPLSLRAEIDRTAILTGLAKLMMASVLNPIPPTGNQRGHASILPFLARSSPGDLQVEGLLRPRMPVLMTGTSKGKLDFTTNQGDMEMESENSKTADRGAFEHPSLATLSTALADSLPQPMDLDTGQVDNRGTKRDREIDGGIQTMPPHLETESAILSPGKKARIETQTEVVMTSQSEESIKRTSTSVEISTSEERSEVEPLVSESALAEAALPSASDASAPFAVFQSTTSVMEQQKIVTGGDDEDMESDDEIPQLNMEPDTDEEDDGSM